MDPELQKKLQAQDEKLEKIWQSVEKTRKYFLVIIWLTIIFFVLPLVVMLFALPAMINSYMGMFEGLM